MTTKNPDAFPRPVGWNGLSHHEEHEASSAQDGMTLRDYFAAHALQGLLAYSVVNPANGNYHENCSQRVAAMTAYEYADEMLAAREVKAEASHAD